MQEDSITIRGRDDRILDQDGGSRDGDKRIHVRCSLTGICDGLEGEAEWSVKGDAGGRRGSGLGLAEEEPELVLNITDV